MTLEANPRRAPLYSVIASCESLTLAERGALSVMHSFGNADGTNIMASISRMATRAKVSRQQMNMYVTKFRREGYITEKGRSSYKNIAQYEICFAKLLEPANTAKPVDNKQKAARKPKNIEHATQENSWEDVFTAQLKGAGYSESAIKTRLELARMEAQNGR